MAGAVKHKFSPKWEGPYIVEEAHPTGHSWLKDQGDIKVYSPISRAHLKKYNAESCKNIFLGPSCQTDILFCKTHTIINKDLYTIISYDVVHKMHAKSK